MNTATSKATETTPAAKPVTSTVTLPDGRAFSVKRAKGYAFAIARKDSAGQWSIQCWTSTPARGLSSAQGTLRAQQKRARTQGADAVAFYAGVEFVVIATA